MKKRWLALLLAALMLPGLAIAAGGDPEPTPVPTLAPMATPRVLDMERKVYTVLDEVPYATTAQEAVDLIMEAADLAGEETELLAECARMLFYMDTTGEFMAETETLLSRALEGAEGETRSDMLQMLSEIMIMTGRAEEALPMIETAQAESPDDDTLKIALATALYYSHRGPEALGLLEELLEDAPRDFEARKLYAAILVDEHRWEDALQAYRQIEAEWPEYLDGLHGQFMTYIACGEFERGMRILDQLLSGGADDAIWLERARIRLWMQYEPEDALDETAALLRKNPEWIDAASIQIGALVLLGRFDEAMEVADAFRPVDESFAELMKTAIDMDRGEWEVAEKRLDSLVTSVPIFAAAWRNLSTTRLTGYDDIEGATRAIARAFRVSAGGAGPDLYTQLGDIYRREGKLLEAARAYAAANANTYDDPSAYGQLLWAYLDAGDAEGAAETLAQMEAAYPGWYETMMARVTFEDLCGNSADALAAYEAVIEKFPFPTSQNEAFHTVLKTLADETAQAESIAALEPMEPKDQEDPFAWIDYGFVLASTGDADGADAALNTAEGLIPEDTGKNGGLRRSIMLSVLSTRMDICLSSEDIDGAVKAISDAAALGWPVRILMLNPTYAPITSSEGYQALLDTLPPLEQPWDLSIDPTIPT